MVNVVIFFGTALLMFYMAWRNHARRQALRRGGQAVQAQVAAEVATRNGKAYALEFEVGGVRHRLNYEVPPRAVFFEKGQQVTLYYDPQDTSRMFVEQDHSSRNGEIFYCLFGIALAALGAAAALRL